MNDLSAPHAHCWVIKREKNRYVPCSHPMKLCDYCGVAAGYGVVFPYNKPTRAKPFSESWLDAIERIGKETLEGEKNG